MCNYIFQQLMHSHKSKMNLLEMHKIRQFGEAIILPCHIVYSG